MDANQHTSPELIRKLLDYDPETGLLTWRARDASMFEVRKRPAASIAMTWNKRFAGKPALDAISNGYHSGTLLGKCVMTHRVVWAIMTGRWPTSNIDHINGIRSDNRWENLRDVRQTLNLRNSPKRTNNTSGHNGVCWDKSRGKWKAALTIEGKVWSRRFNTLEEAVAARKAAEKGHGFTERHGCDV